MDKLEHLFEPIKLASLELPNRIIMPAVTTYYDFEGGNRQANFFAERARGGAALLITGALQTLYPGRRSDLSKVHLHNDADIPRLKEWTKVIHDNGSRAAAQLAVYGYWAKQGRESTPEDVGPSEVYLPLGEVKPSVAQADFYPKVRALTPEEIHLIVEQIGDAAVRAREAGFDAIELQCIGGNFFVRFITPFTNQRTDEYGGTLANRLRVLVETITNIKRKTGDDFPLICRIPGTDLASWGLNLEDWKDIAVFIEKAGVHALTLMPGWHESREPRDQMSVPRGAFAYLAEGLKQVVSIPVAAGTQINDPLLAERIIAEGKADMVTMGRPLIADPALPKKRRKKGGWRRYGCAPSAATVLIAFNGESRLPAP
ncbi:NADH:flavin oxidoreductase [Chloroflexota bacterium]